MTTGTKVFLALFALIVGVLVIYYGVVMPDRADATSDGERIATGDGSNGTSEVMQEAGPRHDPERLSQNQSQDPPERSAPPPRDPAPTVPPANLVAPPNATAARGLLSDGVNEANGGPESGGGVTPVSADAGKSQNPAGTFLPLVGLNDGNLRSNEVGAESKADVEPAANSGEGAPTTQPADPPATAKPADAPAATAPPPAATRIEYVIEEDDTFVSIAEKWFGDENKWSLIAKENPTVDPQKLKIGQKIFLPPKEAGAAPVERQPVLAGGQTLYLVQSGDTLIAIARDELGDQTRWEEIYALNKDTIGADAAALKVGMKLVLPKAK